MVKNLLNPSLHNTYSGAIQSNTNPVQKEEKVFCQENLTKLSQEKLTKFIT